MSKAARNRRFVLVAAAMAVALVHAQPRAAQAPTAVDEVTFRIIVVSSADRARDVADRLATGGDFIAVATAESIDPSSDHGGLIGPVDRAALRPELRDTLGTLAIGQISAVIRDRKSVV